MGHARPVRGQPLREAVSIGTISRGDDLSDFDRTSPQGSPWKSTESTGTSNIQNILSLSSKHSASHDSDAWHSESEANWTMVETYSNQPKDISQSQVLSEDEQKQSQFTCVYCKNTNVQRQSKLGHPVLHTFSCVARFLSVFSVLITLYLLYSVHSQLVQVCHHRAAVDIG